MKQYDVCELKNGVEVEDFYRSELERFAPRQTESWVDGGICPFHASEDGNSFVGTPFTFYVCPDAKANTPIFMLSSTAAFHFSPSVR